MLSSALGDVFFDTEIRSQFPVILYFFRQKQLSGGVRVAVQNSCFESCIKFTGNYLPWSPFLVKFQATGL